MRKVYRLGKVDVGRHTPADVFVRAEYLEGRLSVVGVEGPRSNGDAWGGCGQITIDPEKFVELGPGWDKASIARLRDIWARWHLNDMRAGCEHQRAAGWDTGRALEVVSYGLTHEAMRLRTDTLKAIARAWLRMESLELTPTARALADLDDWFKARHEPPDADSPLSGCYEVKKRETKATGWVYPHEHPAGLLGKACEVCGYKYGHAWQREEVPAEVIAELEAFPEADRAPAWV
jgi:hypothetical protein